jgi:hypothetical protein
MEDIETLSKKCICCLDTKNIIFFTKQVGKNGRKFRDSICNKCKKDKYNFDDLKMQLSEVNMFSYSDDDTLKGSRYKKYNITEQDYNLLYKLQDGECAICKTSQFKLKTKLAVDHCHKTGKVRGLLCSSCNCALGLLKDNKHVIQEALKYLKNSYS